MIHVSGEQSIGHSMVQFRIAHKDYVFVFDDNIRLVFGGPASVSCQAGFSLPRSLVYEANTMRHLVVVIGEYPTRTTLVHE